MSDESGGDGGAASSGSKPLTITLVLDKTNGNGVTLTVVNNQDNITQTIQFDGTAITTTVKGQQNTSVITQKQDSIDINCKTFTIEAETITCKSTKASDYEAEDTMTIKGQNAVVLQSSTADVTVEGNTKVAVTSDTANVEVTCSAGTAKVACMTFDAEATMGATVKANTTISLQGTAQAELKGATVNVSGDAQINLAGPISQVGGSGMTQVQGGVIMIG